MYLTALQQFYIVEAFVRKYTFMHSVYMHAMAKVCMWAGREL
jgi:hypothetical protein